MTKAEDRLAALMERATRGPWTTIRGSAAFRRIVAVDDVGTPEVATAAAAWLNGESDAAFIAASRTLMPDLLAVVSASRTLAELPYRNMSGDIYHARKAAFLALREALLSLDTNDSA